MKTFISPRTGILILMIVLVGTWRLCISSGNSPLTNFTPIGAMCLFGGCYLGDRYRALFIPIFTLWLSDIFINYFVYFHQWKFFCADSLLSYVSFALIVLVGSLIKKVSIKNFLLMSMFAAITHWIITDFGVWFFGKLYPKTGYGLIMSYIAGIPFMKNMLIGNLAFGSIMFIAFEGAQRNIPAIRIANN